MMKLIVLFAVLGASLAAPPQFKAASCPYPNGTATTIHTTNCDAGHKMFINSVKVLNSEGKEMYPIDFKKAITIVLDAQNNGDVYYDNKVSVTLSKYTSSWFKSQCSWQSIPTFGMLSNMDGCEFAHNCPLQKGKLELRLPLDLSGLSGLISMLAGNSAYQLEIQMFNANPGVSSHEEIGCVTTQMRITP